LHLSDTLNPDKKTFVNTSSMKLYSIDKDDEITESDRPILNYRKITNAKGE
jgi:hypothetical protein